MQHKFKLCRVDTLAGAKMAVAAGVDFIGLHAISPDLFSAQRQESFRRIRDYLRRETISCEPILVTLSKEAAFIAEACEKSGISVVQLHAQLDPMPFLWEMAAQMKKRGLGNPLIVKTVAIEDRDGKQVSQEQIKRSIRLWRDWGYCILIDATEHGGMGKTADWGLARSAIEGVPHRRCFIAGGISPENVSLALAKTNAWGADAQSAVEGTPKRGAKTKRVDVLIRMMAAIHDEAPETIARQYRWRRAKPRILYSPSELKDDARQALEATTWTDVDGIQVDAADGTTTVRPWPVSAEQWAGITWEEAPELPLWMHMFSRQGAWIVDTVKAVSRLNPHLTGILVQDDRSPELSDSFCSDLQRQLDVPVFPSISVGQAESYLESPSNVRDKCFLQLTTPSRVERRTERVSAVLSRLKALGTWTHLDRSVDAELLKSIDQLPDGVTVGRAIEHSRFQDSLEEITILLGR